MLWNAEDRSGFASTASLLIVLLRIAAVLGVTAAVLSLATPLPAVSGVADGDLARVVRFAEVAVVAYGAVVFFRWLATACLIARDVSAEEFEFFPHGVVAAFFIPLVNLVLPHRIMKSMCEVSLRACRRGFVSEDGPE